MWLKQLTGLKRKRSSGDAGDMRSQIQLPNNLTLWVTGDNSMRRTLALLTLLAVAALGIGCGSENTNNAGNTTTNTSMNTTTNTTSTPMSTPTPMNTNTGGGNTSSGGNTNAGGNT